jgi:chorismate synthase
MIGCHIGRIFQLTVAGGSYQEGLTSVLQGVPPGLPLSEQGIYGDLLLRKPGADQMAPPPATRTPQSQIALPHSHPVTMAELSLSCS